MTTTYDKVIQLANSLQAEGKYDSTYSAVLAIYQNLTGDTETKFDSTYSIVATIADGIESGDIDLGGGGDEEVKDYNTHKFFNATGNIVAEWTLEETQSKTELPVTDAIGVSGFKLDFDGWNWDLEQLKSASCGQNIGALYRPSDGKTRIVVDIESINLNCYLQISTQGNVIIDWGDGTTEEFNGQIPSHTYDIEGQKIISIDGIWYPQFGTNPFVTQVYDGFLGSYYNTRITHIMPSIKLASLEFIGLANLQYLTFTNDVYSISSSFIKFSKFKSLKHLTLPKSTTTALGAFECPSLESICIPYGVSNIKNMCFGYSPQPRHPNLKYVNIPDSVTEIGEYAFQNCISLESINLPSGITTIRSSAFNGCRNLKQINMQEGILDIQQLAFSNTSISNTKLPSSLTSLGVSVFNQSAIENITFPNFVTSIGTLSNCYNLKSVVIPDSVTSMESNTFANCYKLESVKLSENITSIPNYAFSYCTSLKELIIPNSVTKIGTATFNDNVFQYCEALKYIKMPNNLVSVNYDLFRYTQNSTIDFLDSEVVPELASTSGMATQTILVPSSLYDEWIAATNWSSLTSQIIAV